MQIDETLFPVEVVWQGQLADLEGQRGQQELPMASLGKPMWWDDHKVLGANWSPPSGDNCYGLARFSFSLRPNARETVKNVEFTAYLHAKGAGPHPVFFDLFPKYVVEDKTTERTISVGPNLKFLGVEATAATLETKIKFKQAMSVITADGIGESTAHWRFQDRPAHPLLGSQIVFAIVELQHGAAAARVSLQLSVELTTHFGLIHSLLPKNETESLSWVLE